MQNNNLTKSEAIRLLNREEEIVRSRTDLTESQKTNRLYAIRVALEQWGVKRRERIIDK